ncbi:MAG: hypothetical protein Q8P67_00515 [archaeon]|nr:hypothetical protein [archaeon]
MFEGGKNRTKIWFWLDKPAFDGRSDFMMDTVKAGISLQAHELHVGSRVISHWNEDQPLHVTIPEDHLPSSARIQTSQATGLSYSPPHA